MAVRLEFLTQDVEEMALATRYWAMDEECAYRERVADLVPFREIVQSGQIAKRVRDYCIAFDENQYCYLCNGPVQISARSEAKKACQNSSVPCADCEELLRQQRAEANAAAQVELAKHLASIAQRNASITITYEYIPDDAVLVLLAIDALVAPRLANGTFTVSDCGDLSPYNPGFFVRELYTRGYLLTDPYAAAPGTYFMKEDGVWHVTAQIQYFLPPDDFSGRGQEALGLIKDREFTDSDALVSLWLDYAVGDVMRYLLDQCRIYSHDLETEAVEKIKSTVRHGLQTYSVAQLWSVAWKAVKDAASLANREYYNRPKAAATIPNKIRKLIEIAEQEGGIPRSWDRPDHHLSGSLGMIFHSLFSIDEYSPGREVIEMFTALGRARSHDANDALLSLTQTFMTAALGGPDAGAVLEMFAERIRAGLTTEDAMTEVIHQHGDLFP